MDDGAFVEVALNVEVDKSPVKTPDGPISIGTMTRRVFPLLSVVVLVNVDLRVVVRSVPG
jgi:hypothetical protein